MPRPFHILLSFLVGPSLAAQEIHEVRLLDIRPVGEDYAPVPHGDGFVMCSIREEGAAIDFRDAVTGKPLSDLYLVPFTDGRPGVPRLFSPALATPVNEGPAAFFPDGRTICYTRNQQLPKKLSNMRKADMQLGLFFSTLEDGQWSAPEPFEHNHPKHSFMHPTISPDGTRLIFSSDRPGGSGGMDLYVSQRTTTGWSVPENLGPDVNGPHHEVYPRYAPDGSFYFSSDRPGGMGGLDIYHTLAGHDGRMVPMTMPEPVNSPHNDVGYAALGDGRKALFSSDRTGTDRIHLAERTLPKFRDCAPQRYHERCYAFNARKHAATARLPLDHAWDLGDGTILRGDTVLHCYADTGHYTVKSMLVDRKTGAMFQTLRTHVMEVRHSEQAFILATDTVRTGRTLQLDASRSNLPTLAGAEYHWDMGDGQARTGTLAQHAFRKAGTYEVRLDIITSDDQGRLRSRCNTKTVVVLDRYREQDDQTALVVYQDAMGQWRKKEFVELPYDDLGIDPWMEDDVKFTVQLFATRERMSLDDPRFAKIRQQHRIVERFDPIRAVYTYSVGETNDPDELYAIFQIVKDLQFLDAEVFSLRTEQLVDLSRLDLDKLQDLGRTRLRTDMIHFAYKSAEIGEGSEEALESIHRLMLMYPGLHLVVEAHTDDIGSRAYNIDLSQRRALAVIDQLVAQGIDPDRLVPMGHGKNQPIASNKTEEGRQFNRRVEFKLSTMDELQAGAQRPSTPK